tara:strand:- start:1582 stop:1971 length:390 start_codon:yes stop_codon:yes gene_type:complete
MSTDTDTNNSSLNNLIASFTNLQSSLNFPFENIEGNLVCIDTSENRIGINTLDPTCSLDISGTDGKISVESISCENLTINNNLDISGTIDLSSNGGTLNIIHIDLSSGKPEGTLYYDNSGFVKIKFITK